METIKTQASFPEENGMLRMTTKEAQTNLAEIVQQVAAEDKRVILTQDGKAIAAVISIEAFDFLERMVEKIENEIDIEDSLAALAEAEEKGTIPFLTENLGWTEAEIKESYYRLKRLQEDWDALGMEAYDNL